MRSASEKPQGFIEHDFRKHVRITELRLMYARAHDKTVQPAADRGRLGYLLLGPVPRQG